MQQTPASVQQSTPSTPANFTQPTLTTPPSVDQTPSTTPEATLDPTVLVDFIQPHLTKGTTYTALATLVGHRLGHQYTAMLESIAAEVETYHTGGTPPPQQYSLAESAHGHWLGAYILAFTSLPLTEKHTYTPGWNSEIMNSKVTPRGEPSNETSVHLVSNRM